MFRARVKDFDEIFSARTDTVLLSKTEFPMGSECTERACAQRALVWAVYIWAIALTSER